MADIFISYAQRAPEPTQALAADLAALKYSYWFDERLLPVDTFIDVINTELDKAKAVITIWTPPAFDSKWVKAEALRAFDQDKLVNIHTPDVHPGKIMVPFNSAMISPISDMAKIREGLAKLGVHAGVAAPVEKAARDASEAALAFEHIKDSDDIEDFQQFLADFAGGKPFYLRLAKKKIAVLSASRGAVSPGALVARRTAEAAEVPLPQAGDVFLRIEPGMHTAAINRVGVNAAGTLMVTGSEDKTARLWALPQSVRGEARLVRTFRVPIGEGDDGKVYAVALSPDGQWVAAGGWDQNAQTTNDVGVYIFEAATGRLVTRLGRLSNVIYHLAFSPDGRRLAAVLGGGEGMRLWDTATWTQAPEDKAYGGSGSDSYGAAFDGAGRLYTVAYDGQIRRYGAEGRLEAKAATQGGQHPFSIAVHAGGRKLAVSFDDSTAVEVYDAGSLKRLYKADTSGISGGNLFAVGWSADGARLYAGGRHWGGSARDLVIWQEEGRGRPSQAPLSQNTIMQLLPVAGGIAAGAADPAFGLLDADGAKRIWQEGVTADMRGKKRGAFTLSADGRRVRFGLGVGEAQPMLFDLAAFTLDDAPQPAPDLAAPKTAGLAVSDWEDSTAPKLNGKPIALDQHESSRALAIAPDSQRFLLGAEYWLRAYRANGSELWKKAIPGIAWGVNIAGNGTLLAAAYDDGTIRWHRMSDGQELLALFVHAKDRRFVAWTPKGYYAASPGAEDLIGWHVNRGFDTAPDFYPASTFASTFRRPDIVQAALNNVDAPAPASVEPEGLLGKIRKLF
jgi:WD40 repeat protein